MALYEKAIENFRTKQARIAVMGLGYAGLPLALSFAEAGFRTLGLDVDEEKIAKLRRGQSYIKHIPSTRLGKLVSAGTFVARGDFECLVECDAAIICVPTPLDQSREPDLKFVSNTADSVGDRLHAGQLVALESTTYPGTTKEVLLPIFQSTGLRVGEDFFLAFSPEREDPGNGSYDTRSIPKLVGGVTEVCGKVAVSAYSGVVDNVVPVSNATIAEAAKLLENVYRCVNIAMVNELKLLFERMDIDLWEVIRAASSKPFGFTPFYPGPGLGGHCIPIDPFYLTWKARQYNVATRFIELAGEINTIMPVHVVERLTEGLNLRGKALRGAKILLIGVAYKRDVDDIRGSPALAIIKLLEAKLADIAYYDPYVPRLQSNQLSRGFASVELTRQAVEHADAVVIVTDHSQIDYDHIVEHAALVIDTRGATRFCSAKNGNVMTA